MKKIFLWAVISCAVLFYVGWVTVEYYWTDGAVIQCDGRTLTVAVPHCPATVGLTHRSWFVESAHGYSVAVGYSRPALRNAALQEDAFGVFAKVVLDSVEKNGIVEASDAMDDEIERLAVLHSVDLAPIIRVGVSGVRIKKIDISGIVLVLVDCTQVFGGADISTRDGAEVRYHSQ